MKSQKSYFAYLLIIILLFVLWIGASVLKEKTRLEANIRSWSPENISLEDLGFTPPRFQEGYNIRKQNIYWKDAPLIAAFAYSDQRHFSSVILFGPDFNGETEIKDILILSNGNDGVYIDKIPQIIQVLDINGDNNPEFIVDMGSYIDLEPAATGTKYTILSYDIRNQDLIWLPFVDLNAAGQEVERPYSWFVRCEAEGLILSFECDPETHTIRQYMGTKADENNDWKWQEAVYELAPGSNIIHYK